MTKTLAIISSVFKKKFLKKVFGFLILIGLGAMLFAKNDVSAQLETPNVATENSQVQKMSEINELFTYLSRTIYALLWPVLFIAGIALDNRLVYGSFLHLDASLWTLWNIMKNFANFALGFMVLFAIVKNIFTAPFGKSGDKRGPVAIIKKTLIAGVLIQASWFLMAAVIDVSTILTYSIGGLPMTIMQNNPKQANLPILGVNAVLSTKGDTNKMDLQYYNTYGDNKISQCQTQKVLTLTGDFIVGRKQIKVDTETFFEEGYCTLGGWPYKYMENPDYKNFSTGDNGQYKKGLENYFSSGSNVVFSGLVKDCKIIPTDFSELSDTCSNAGYGILKKDDKFFLDAKDEKSIKYTIDNLLDKSKGFVGPFITIYSSLLGVSELASDSSGNGVVADFLDLIIKLFFAVILFFPLVALAVVLIARIGILWLVISASPIIVLWKVFEEILGKGKSDGLMGHFELSNIIKLIFAPVFVVFAISMSMIFLSALNNRGEGKLSGINTEQMSQLGMERINDKTYSILGLIEITLDIDKVDKGMDMFAWFITMFFATGIVWFFLFFAIRMTKIGESVGKGIQESIENLARNMPIVPIGGGAVGINAAKGALSALGNRLPSKMNTDQKALLQEKYPWLYPGSTTSADRGETAKLSTLSKGDLSTVVKDIKEKGIESAFESNKSILAAADIASSAELTSAFNEYVISDVSSFANVAEFIKPGYEDASNKNITTYDAERFTSGTIENMVVNQEEWKKWAEDVVGGNVKTADGVKVMANVGTHNNPQFKLLTQEEYQKYSGSDPAKIQENLKKQLEGNYVGQNKPADIDKTEWDKDKDKYIDEQIAKHMENAEKRLRTDNSGSNNNKQETPPVDQTSTAGGGSNNTVSDDEKE